MRKIILGLLMFMAFAGSAFADSQGSATGGTAGTQSTGAGCINQSPTLSSGQQMTLACDGSGNLKVTGTSTVTGAVTTTPGQRTLVTLDVKTVTTGGTAVTAIAVGHRTAGGFLQNPIGATIALCINEIGAATGTTSSGDTTCIPPGASYNVAPAATGVSVITSDSSHPFSGYGMN